MALTAEEKTYFLKGIDLVFKIVTKITLAKSYIVDDADPKYVIAKLDEKLDGKFVAAASAAGVITPKSIIDISQVDIANTQKFIGLDSKLVLNSQESINLNDKISELKVIIGNSNLSVFANPTITAALIELYKDMIDIFDLLSVNKGSNGEINSKTDNLIKIFGNSSYKISGDSRTLTSCNYDFKTKSYSLNKVITQSHITILGLEKSKLECTNWALLKVAHYFTTTGDIEDCAIRGYIPEGLVYEECVAALGISNQDVNI
jgi:hypothetical protein